MPTILQNLPGNPHTGPLGSLLPLPQGRKRLRLTLLPLDRGPQCHPTQGEDTGGSEESAGPSYPEGSGQRPPAPTSAGHKAIWSLPTGPGGVLVQTILEQIPTRPETERDKCQHSGAGELGRGAGAVFTPLYVKIRAQREVTYYIRQGHGGKVKALRILHVTFRGLSTQSHE